MIDSIIAVAFVLTGLISYFVARKFSTRYKLSEALCHFIIGIPTWFLMMIAVHLLIQQAFGVTLFY